MQKIYKIIAAIVSLLIAVLGVTVKLQNDTIKKLKNKPPEIQQVTVEKKVFVDRPYPVEKAIYVNQYVEVPVRDEGDQWLIDDILGRDKQPAEQPVQVVEKIVEKTTVKRLTFPLLYNIKDESVSLGASWLFFKNIPVTIGINYTIKEK